MDEGYLWDRSGPVDPDVERLEKLLGRFRSRRPAPKVPRRRPGITLLLRAAALLALAAGVVWFARLAGRGAWEVAHVDGAPRVGAKTIGRGGFGRLAVGQWLETDGSSRAKLEVGRIGQVKVEPNSRVRLLRSRLTEQRLALERGEISAQIWAPPRLFFVETPSALATDLGCAYTLAVDGRGAGLLRVSMGWVELEGGDRESIVPAGASCITRPGAGPGTPSFEDAPRVFREALEKFDFGGEKSTALDAVLSQARARDAVTLWHLLKRLGEPELTRVYDRLAALLPPPAGVTQEGIARRDDRMLELWRSKLNLPRFRKEAPFWRRAWYRILTSLRS